MKDNHMNENSKAVEDAMDMIFKCNDRAKVIKEFKRAGGAGLSCSEAVELSALILASSIGGCPAKRLALGHFFRLLTKLDDSIAVIMKE